MRHLNLICNSKNEGVQAFLGGGVQLQRILEKYKMLGFLHICPGITYFFTAEVISMAPTQGHELAQRAACVAPKPVLISCFCYSSTVKLYFWKLQWVV
jgi:hypothetical protein